MKAKKGFVNFLINLLNDIEINDFVFNYFYKENSGGDRMKQLHQHQAVEIECVLEGEVLIHFENDIIRLSRNEFIIILPNIKHMYAVEEGVKSCRRVNIQLNQYMLDYESMEMMSETMQSATGYIKMPRNPDITDTMRKITFEIANHLWESEVMIKAKITCLLIAIIREIRTSLNFRTSAKSEYVQIASHLISEQFANQITPQDIAEQLHISPGYLMHMFKRETGMTMMQYLRNVRMVTAKSKLMTTDDPIFQIASDIGVANPQQFSMIFRKETGIAPAQYRRLSRNIIYKYVD